MLLRTAKLTASSSGVPATDIQDFLNLKATFDRINRKPKIFDEVTQLSKFAALWWRVNAMQEVQLQVIQPSRDRLVGGEHELFDDLMAFRVMDSEGTFDLA